MVNSAGKYLEKKKKLNMLFQIILPNTFHLKIHMVANLKWNTIENLILRFNSK